MDTRWVTPSCSRSSVVTSGGAPSSKGSTPVRSARIAASSRPAVTSSASTRVPGRPGRMDMLSSSSMTNSALRGGASSSLTSGARRAATTSASKPTSSRGEEFWVTRLMKAAARSSTVNVTETSGSWWLRVTGPASSRRALDTAASTCSSVSRGATVTTLRACGLRSDVASTSSICASAWSRSMPRPERG